MTTTSPEIRLADIEKELHNLWETQKDKKLIKASLFNLIIYADVKEKSDFLDDMVKTILEKYPCRIIFISGNTDPSKNALQTSVANIIVGKGENAVACDRINIDVSPQQLHRVPFIILPLLIPDLPIYLLWGKDPTGEMDILPHLRPYASRLIFDSDSTHNLQDFSREMLKEIDAGTLEIRDINWAAAGSWREILTHLFNTAEKIKRLRNCKNLRLEFNGACAKHISHPEIQAIYLQAWLAAQMGWQYDSYKQDKGSSQIVYSQGDHQVLVELIPMPLASKISGSIQSIEINTSSENIVIIAKQGDQSKATVHISTEDRCEMPNELPLPDMRKGLFLIQELFYRQTSTHYRNMLSLISHYGRLA